MKNRILFLVAIIISIATIAYGQGYVMEWEIQGDNLWFGYLQREYDLNLVLPLPQTADELYDGLSIFDMEGDGIIDLAFLTDDSAVSFYDGATHNLKWYYQFEEGTCLTPQGFYDFDNDGVKEILFNGWGTDEFDFIQIVDWVNSEVVFELGETGNSVLLASPPFDIDGDNLFELLIKLEDVGSYQIWGYNPNIGTDDNSGYNPKQYKLSQNYPNPFNPTTTINYQLKKLGYVELKIYNIKGQLIDTLVNEHQYSGSHSVVWNAKGFSSGVYFYQISVDDQLTKTKKAIYLK